MSEGYAPIWDDENEELVGYAFEGEDGVMYAANLAGEVTAAEVDGEVYEVEPGYVVADDEFPGAEVEADPHSAFDERLDALEQRVAEPPEPPPNYFPQGDQVDAEQATAAMLRDRRDLETVEDRPLLLDERRRLAERMAQQADAGEDVDGITAAADLEELGQPLLNLDDEHRGRAHEARSEFMAKRIADQERYQAAERGEDDLSSSTRPASQDYFDMDDRGERLAYYSERLEGRDVDAGSTYSSSDITEEE